MKIDWGFAGRIEKQWPPLFSQTFLTTQKKRELPNFNDNFQLSHKINGVIDVYEWKEQESIFSRIYNLLLPIIYKKRYDSVNIVKNGRFCPYLKNTSSALLTLT